jgi:hypothetical protein
VLHLYLCVAQLHAQIVVLCSQFRDVLLRVPTCAQRVRDVSTCSGRCGCREVAQQVKRCAVSGMSDTSNPVRALLRPGAQQVGILEDTELLVTSAAANQRNDVRIHRTDGVREFRPRQHVGWNRLQG